MSFMRLWVIAFLIVLAGCSSETAVQENQTYVFELPRVEPPQDLEEHKILEELLNETHPPGFSYG